jgi:cyclophilin family peptidyl-prolyl cis-trans isomerase
MKKGLYIYLIFVVCLFGCEKFSNQKPNKNDDTAFSAKQDQLNQQRFQKESVNTLVEQRDTSEITNEALIKTNLGEIKIGLFGKDAPRTVENFIGLINQKYYDGILFHRVAYDFLIQAGDKNTKFRNKKADWGKGGDSFFEKPFEDELFSHTTSYKNGYQFGTLAMANKGPNTNTSQFFICLKEAIKLKNKYTIFGKVLEGMPIVEKIASVEITPSNYDAFDGVPIEPVVIKSITLIK